MRFCCYSKKKFNGFIYFACFPSERRQLSKLHSVCFWRTLELLLFFLCQREGKNDFCRGKKRQRQTVSWDIIYFQKKRNLCQKVHIYAFYWNFILFPFDVACFSIAWETSRLLPTLNKQKGHFLLCHFMFHFQFHYSFYKLTQCVFKAFLDSRLNSHRFRIWWRNGKSHETFTKTFCWTKSSKFNFKLVRSLASKVPSHIMWHH